MFLKKKAVGLRMAIQSIFLFFAHAAYPQVSEFNARQKILDNLPSNSSRAITAQKIRETLDISISYAAKMTPSLTSAQIRAGKADTARSIYLNEGAKSGNFVYDPLCLLPDDSCMVIAFGDRKYVRVADKILDSRWFGIKGTDWGDDSKAVQKMVKFAKDGATLEFDGTMSYRFSGIKWAAKTLHFRFNGARIFQKSKENVFDAVGQWGAIKSVARIKTINKTPNVVAELIASSAGLVAGDIVKVYSENALPDGQTANRKAGEFAMVAETTDSSIVLQSYLRDLPLYKTNVRVAKLFNHTATFSDVSFVLDAAGSESWSGSSGAESFIRLSSFVNPKITNVRVEKSASNAVVLHSDFGYVVEKLFASDLPDQPDIQKFGYGVVDANSEYGVVGNSHFINTRHGYTTNTYPIFAAGSPNEPANYGRSFGAYIHHSVGKGARHAAFDTHDGSRSITFDNCRHDGVGYRPQPNSNEYNGYSFQLRGKDHTLLNCESTGFNGIHVYTNSSITGGDIYENWAAGIRIIDCKIEAVNNALFVEKAQDVTVSGGKFYKPYLYTNDFLFKLRDANVRMENVFGVSKTAAAEFGSGAFLLRNSSLDIDGGKFDLSFLSKTATGLINNYNNDFVRITENVALQAVRLKNIQIIADSLPLNAYVNNSSGNSSNTLVKIDGLDHRKIFGLVSLANSTNVQGGSLSTETSGGSAGVVQSAFNYKGVSYSYLNSLNSEQTNFKNIVKSTNGMQDVMRSMDDKALFYNITPTANLGLNSFYPGRFEGQLMAIRNNSVNFEMTIASGISNIALLSSITIAPGNVEQFIYTSSGWSLYGSYSGAARIREINNQSTTLRASDHIIAFVNVTTPKTLTTIDGAALKGRTFIVKDGTGNAATNPITINGPIDGDTSKVINTNFGFIRLYYDGVKFYTF